MATILFGEAGQRSSAAPSPGGALDGGSGADGEATVPGSWQSLPTSPRGGQPGGRRVSSLVPGLQQQQQQQQQQQAATVDVSAASGGSSDAALPDAGAAAAGAPAAAAAPAPSPAPGPAVGQSPAPSTRTVTQEELAAEQSGDWQVGSNGCSGHLLLVLLLLQVPAEVCYDAI